MRFDKFILLATLLFASSCNLLKHESTTVTKITSAKIDPRIPKENETKHFFEVEKKRLLKDRNESLIAYLDFVKKYPNNATGLYNLARIQLESNNVSNALLNAKQALNLQPDNITFREFYVQTLIFNDQLSSAEKQLDTLLISNPTEEEYVFKKTMIFLQRNELNKALKGFDELEKLLGLNEELLIQKKNILVRNNKIKEADEVLCRLEKTFPETAKYTVMRIELAVRERDSVKVDSLFNILESAYPNDAQAQITLAQYYASHANYEKYQAYLNRIIHSKNIDVTSKLSILLPAIRMTESDTSRDENFILKLAQENATKQSKSENALQLYADLLFYTRNPNEAKVYYEKVITLNNQRKEIWNQLLGIYFDAKQYDTIIEITKRNPEIFERSNLAFFYQGISHLQLQNPSLATTSLENAIRLTSYNAELLAQMHSSLGDAYNQTKQFGRSDSNFKLALRYAPDEPGILNNYAYYLSVRDTNLEEAEKMSKRSLLLQPNTKSFLDTYAWILYQLKNYEDAKVYLEKSIQADGDNDATIFEHYGDILFKLNQVNNAILNWQKALDLDKENEKLKIKIRNSRINE